MQKGNNARLTIKCARYFAGMLWATIILAIAHIFYKIFCFTDHKVLYELATPFTLVYGPLLYFMYRIAIGMPLSRKQMILHLCPLIFFTCIYILAIYGAWRSAPWAEMLLKVYVFEYLIGAVSLAGYAVYIGLKKKAALFISSLMQELIGQMAVLNVLIAFFLGMLLVREINIGIDLNFDPRMFLYLIVGFDVILALRYQLLSGKFTDSPEHAELAGTDRYANSNLDEKAFQHYEQQLHAYLIDSKLYLQPELSLDLLVAKTHIPKHHCSQLFNVYLGKSFYQVIAEYRIKYAISLLESGDQLTIETLSYQCGFNSKSSFNRYFKAYTGFTPSTYRGVNLVPVLT